MFSFKYWNTLGIFRPLLAYSNCISFQTVPHWLNWLRDIFSIHSWTSNLHRKETKWGLDAGPFLCWTWLNLSLLRLAQSCSFWLKCCNKLQIVGQETHVVTLLLSYNVMSCRNVRETKIGFVKYQSFLADRLTGWSFQFQSLKWGGGSWKVTAQADVFEIFRDFRMRFWKPFWGFTTAHMGKKTRECIIHCCTHVRADIFENWCWSRAREMQSTSKQQIYLPRWCFFH